MRRKILRKYFISSLEKKKKKFITTKKKKKKKTKQKFKINQNFNENIEKLKNQLETRKFKNSTTRHKLLKTT